MVAVAAAAAAPRAQSVACVRTQIQIGMHFQTRFFIFVNEQTRSSRKSAHTSTHRHTTHFVQGWVGGWGDWSYCTQPAARVAHHALRSPTAPHQLLARAPPLRRAVSPCRRLAATPPFAVARRRAVSVVGLHRQLDLGDRLAWVEVLGARLRAVHDGFAAVDLEGVVEELEALLRLRVARVRQPPV